MHWQPYRRCRKRQKNDLADVIVYTDGIGAKQTKNLKSQLQATIRVVGSPVSNVANTFLSCTKDSSGDTYTVASGVTNYSDHAANMEITLYEERKFLKCVHFPLPQTRHIPACLNR